MQTLSELLDADIEQAREENDSAKLVKALQDKVTAVGIPQDEKRAAQNELSALLDKYGLDIPTPEAARANIAQAVKEGTTIPFKYQEPEGIGPVADASKYNPPPSLGSRLDLSPLKPAEPVPLVPAFETPTATERARGVVDVPHVPLTPNQIDIVKDQRKRDVAPTEPGERTPAVVLGEEKAEEVFPLRKEEASLLTQVKAINEQKKALSSEQQSALASFNQEIADAKKWMVLGQLADMFGRALSRIGAAKAGAGRAAADVGVGIGMDWKAAFDADMALIGAKKEQVKAEYQTKLAELEGNIELSKVKRAEEKDARDYALAVEKEQNDKVRDAENLKIQWAHVKAAQAQAAVARETRDALRQQKADKDLDKAKDSFINSAVFDKSTSMSSEVAVRSALTVLANDKASSGAKTEAMKVVSSRGIVDLEGKPVVDMTAAGKFAKRFNLSPDVDAIIEKNKTRLGTIDQITKRATDPATDRDQRMKDITYLKQAFPGLITIKRPGAGSGEDAVSEQQ